MDDQNSSTGDACSADNKRASSVIDSVFKEFMEKKQGDVETDKHESKRGKDSDNSKDGHRPHHHHHKKKHKKEKHRRKEACGDGDKLDKTDPMSEYDANGETVQSRVPSEEKEQHQVEEKSKSKDKHRKKDKKHKKHKHKDREKDKDRDLGKDDKQDLHEENHEKDFHEENHEIDLHTENREKDLHEENREKDCHEENHEEDIQDNGEEVSAHKQDDDHDQQKRTKDHKKRDHEKHKHKHSRSKERETHKHSHRESTNIPKPTQHPNPDTDDSRKILHDHSSQQTTVKSDGQLGSDEDVIVIDKGHAAPEIIDVDSGDVMIVDGKDTRDHRRRHKERRHRRHRSKDHNNCDDSLGGSSAASRPQSGALEYLWVDQEEPETESPKMPPNIGVVSDQVFGSSWMALPKDLDKDVHVNAASWMRLPNDMNAAEEDSPGFDSDHERTDFKKIVRRANFSEIPLPPSLDVKVDMAKAVGETKPPPTTETAQIVSSIADDIIGDLQKMHDNFQKEKKKADEKAQEHEVVQTEGSLKVTVSNDGPKDGNSTEIVGAKKKLGLGLKLGIKISQTSAALIASGEKVENDPRRQNMEEGEVTDSSAANDNPAEDEGDDVSSTSEIDISQLSSSGSVSDSDQEPTGTDADTKEEVDKDKKKKKSKKSKHKKKKKKESKKRHSSHSRSKSPKRRKRSRSVSRSRARSFDEEKGVWRDSQRSKSHRSRSRDRHRRSRDKDYHDGRKRSRDRSKDRSRDPDRYSRHRRSQRRSRSRSRSRSPKGRTEDLRFKIDKAKLRQIALRNANALMKLHNVASHMVLKPDEVAALRAGGKSVEELTDYCKKISQKETNLSSSGDDSGPELALGSEDEAPFINHPFKVKDAASIVMNIRNARQIPILTPLEKQSKSSELRIQFPVSSGSHHRAKEWVPVEKTSNTTTTVAILGDTTTKTTASASGAPKAIEGKKDSGSGLKAICAPPVVTPATTAASTVKPEDKVFPDVVPCLPINIGAVVSERLSAMRKLQDNPHDVQALGTMFKANETMSKWAESKNLPGAFTGSTGANILSQSELKGIHQAWTKKDQLRTAAPVDGGIGKLLLQRMGWKEGTGLGKEEKGSLEPLLLDVKVDRKGLTANEEMFKRAPQAPTAKDLSAKHPVSALVELCNRRRWGAPQFELVHESGPDHKKNFLFKVHVNSITYQSTIASTNKKQAKAQAAAICLQELGLVPR